ncbi:MAG TPA: GNAT family N-acetyltransferase, partial [Gaiellaceae bacterium]|nr:GNAT family N-acetyltransferase [Gaiellaceae bacterium]
SSSYVRLTPEIIAAMHELALEQRRLLGVRAPWHVGDVTWGLRQHEGREDEWRIRIWKDADRTVAWSWLKGDRGLLEFDVRRDRLDLLDEILADPDARTAVAFEDDEEMQAALARNGFAADEEAAVTRHSSLMHFLTRDLDEAPELTELPEGFRYRTVEPGDLAERVAIHRDVWAPSRVTESSFATVQDTWPYRATLDCVVEAPDGRFAAYALMWPDDENGVGELEPVGVRDEFRRRGLGTAVCTFALWRWHEEGGRQAIVYCVDDAACGLYESLGFRRHATLVGYSR